ncbi:MAG: ATP-dependent RecD-like DNA helicase [Oscillatoriales cyanobacterium RM2_1_1]|nr:ATP-dependent RecD-like DNA helicase [Oscillatoriales cyanobacterium RM2_1_1]
MPKPLQYRTNTKTPTEQLTGVVERITFHSQESGYTVARIQLPRARDLVTAVGSFANIQPGQTLQLSGQWRDHPQYGSQFQVENYTETKPATLTGMEKYLGSGLIKGVGPVTAKRIVNHFGLETLDVIEQQLDRLSEIKGIGKKRINQIQRAWVEQQAIKEVMVFLQGHGVSTTYAVKIYKHYGQDSIATVTHNPYRLAQDIYGIGFLTADKIAQNIGISPWSKHRYQAGVVHVLSEATENGHCYLPEPELVEQAYKLLTTEQHESAPQAINRVIQDMGQEKSLMLESDSETTTEATPPPLLCYKPTLFHTERHIAKLLNQHLSRSATGDMERVHQWIARFSHNRGISLSEQQQQAVEMAAYAPIMVLTGGPGCGKTFVTHTIVSLWKAMGKTVALAAPTGRAAQRLGEMTQLEAKTLHRTLEFDPKNMGFKRGEDYPLSADAIVVDEASMLDVFLANSLVKAVPKNAQLLLVGDVDQLPSVGPGSVLKDLINSAQIPVVRLTQVFRQAAQSAIITAAHQINKGQFPKLEPVSNRPQSDCLWHSGGETPEQGVQVICDLVEHCIPKLGFNPRTEMQVLAPMIRGVVGTRNLNRVLQQLLNPPEPGKVELTRGGVTLRVGDRVIQLTNDYGREVFNGDLGVVQGIDTVEQEVQVQYRERLVSYDYADLKEISLAWSISIHKSQGSEFPVVILPVYMQHFMMLSRNLVYTGITRAKKLVILVGGQKAIAVAVKSTDKLERYTRLKQRLLEMRG